MDVLARLSPPFLSHLRAVLGRDHSVLAVEEWSAIPEVLRAHVVDVAVVEPRDADGVHDADIKGILERYPSLPLVIYTSLTPEAMRVTVGLASYGVRHVVLRGFDDEPRQFRTMLERLPAYALSDQMLQALGRSLASAPPGLARAIERMFRAPQQFHNVDDLATAAGMTRRSVDRWLDRVGVRSAKMLVISARMVRAYHYMRDPGYLLEDVAVKLGYASSRLFARQMRLATGLMPSAVRAEVAPDAFVAQLARRIHLRRRAPSVTPRGAYANDTTRGEAIRGDSLPDAALHGDASELDDVAERGHEPVRGARGVESARGDDAYPDRR